MTNEKNQSWWQTMPGILTALAGLVTAVAALIGVLNQSGMFGGEDGAEVPATAADVPQQSAPPPVVQPPVAQPPVVQQPVVQQPAIQQPVVEPPVEPSAETTDGWTIIGKTRSGDFFDLKLMVHDDSPAIGRRYDAVDDFRLVQKRPQGNADDGQVITLGMVRRGDSVEVLDLFIPTPSTETVPVWAKLRAVLDRR